MVFCLIVMIFFVMNVLNNGEMKLRKKAKEKDFEDVLCVIKNHLY